MHAVAFWKSVLLACGGFVSVFGVNNDGNRQIQKESFSCDGRTSGYYADVSAGCQVYHMCDGLGRQFSYRCPSKTLFQQRMLICDHWYMVNCSKSEEDYSANLLIGQQGRAFVEDLQFDRTPRPDLADPNVSDLDTTYRANRKFHKNVVGAEEDEDSDSDDHKYSVPTHWSTEFSPARRTTASPPSKREESNVAVVAVPGFVRQTYYRTNYNSKNNNGQPQSRGDKVLDLNDDSADSQAKSSSIGNNAKSNDNEEEVVLPKGVNFPSSFKATTPVYPKHIDIDLSKFTEFGNPLEEDVNSQESVNFPSKFKATTPVYPKRVETDVSRLSEFDIPVEDGGNVDTVFVNFASNFKATTPVYPTHVDIDPSKLSEFDLSIDKTNVVNFASKFKATTPVYPKEVDVDLSKFSGFEETPPEQHAAADAVVVNFASKFKATTPVYPEHVDVDLSKFLEPVELPKDTNNKTVNFGSKFKATTPVYPQSVEATSPIPEEFGLLPPRSSNTNKDVDNNVNFQSNFQATTPVYPKNVEATSPNPSDVGLLAPQLTGQTSQSVDQVSGDIQPPSFDTAFKRRVDEEDPSVLGNTFSSKQLTEFMLTIKPEQLKDLKQLWHIPDYDFPLETASRPSYESDFSSFQAIPKAAKTSTTTTTR